MIGPLAGRESPIQKVSRVQIIVPGKQQNSSVEQKEAVSDTKAFLLVSAGQPQRVGQDVVGRGDLRQPRQAICLHSVVQPTDVLY